MIQCCSSSRRWASTLGLRADRAHTSSQSSHWLWGSSAGSDGIPSSMSRTSRSRAVGFCSASVSACSRKPSFANRSASISISSSVAK
ncbi:MAG TPA: hypothetical protein VGL44_10415 [Gaiellales bacterium]